MIFPSRLTLHQVTGLNPNKEYRFRVYAENVFGRSDPSDTSASIMTLRKYLNMSLLTQLLIMRLLNILIENSALI